MIKNISLRIFPNSIDLFKTVAEDFAQRARKAVNAKGEFTVVLSGGNTVKFFLDAISGEDSQIPWQQIKFFFGDERYVPADNVDSNYHTAKEHLFSKVPVPAENIHRIPTEFSDPNIAAKQYEMTLRTALHLKNNEFPKFDLIYLGLGDDAHTASLMPFSDIIKTYSSNITSNKKEKNDQLVATLWVAALNMYRITLTPCAINNSSCICFLVTGANKASAVWQTLRGPFDPEQYPAQLIHCADEKTIWYLDQAAAGKLGNFSE